MNKTKTKTSTETRKRKFERLLDVDFVRFNTHSSQGESQLYIFEDDEAVHDEGLPFPTKEVGNYSRTLNILDGSIKDKCVDMGDVHAFENENSHPSWTELFGEFGDLQEHELRGNSELIQHHTEIDIGAF